MRNPNLVAERGLTLVLVGGSNEASADAVIAGGLGGAVHRSAWVPAAGSAIPGRLVKQSRQHRTSGSKSERPFPGPALHSRRLRCPLGCGCGKAGSFELLTKII